MFLFRSFETVKKEQKVADENESSEDFIIDSVYVICLNGDPVSYRKDRMEVFKKMDEMRDRLKFQLICDGYKVYDEMDYDKEVCRIYSKGVNVIFGGENLEYIISWKKISNN